MQNFIVENLEGSQVYFAVGLPVNLMVKVYDTLGKEKEFKALESVLGFDLVVINNAEASFNNVVYQNKLTDSVFALVKPNIMFEVVLSDVTYYSQVYRNELLLDRDKLELQKKCVPLDLSGLKEEEKKAMLWLENGYVGLSSLALCAEMFPKLKHYKLENVDTTFFPRDTADFKRCMGFLEAVPEVKHNLSKMSGINAQWAGLVNHWKEIETLINLNNEESNNAAYEIMKKVTNRNKKPTI